jgi:hypothetical protein
LLRVRRDTARFRDMSNIIEYIREACWFEVHYLWPAGQSLGESRNRAITNGANVTQFLGENYIRLQLTQKLLIDRVNCAVIVQRPPHPLIDFPTRQASPATAGHWTMRDSWPRACFLREITFMRNADHLVQQAKRRCNLSRSWQKRNDPEHFSFYALSPIRIEKGA